MTTSKIKELYIKDILGLEIVSRLGKGERRSGASHHQICPLVCRNVVKLPQWGGTEQRGRVQIPLLAVLLDAVQHSLEMVPRHASLNYCYIIMLYIHMYIIFANV